MATLSSPGVAVQVINESFYAPAEPGTTPLIIVATAENKLNGAGTGIAPGTLKVNADSVYLITGQKDLVDTFGDPVFQTDSNNNPIHAGELNEYGLQAAYSFLGVSNRAFVVRADIDLNQLEPSIDEPASTPENGTYWFDTKDSLYGIFRWNGAPATVSGGQTFSNIIPLIPVAANIDSNGVPLSSYGWIGAYAVVTTTTSNEIYYKIKDYNDGTSKWVLVGSNEWMAHVPTVSSTKAISSFSANDELIINGVTIVAPSSNIADLVSAINEAFNGVSAVGSPFYGAITASVNTSIGVLNIYNNGSFTASPTDTYQGDVIDIRAGSVGTLVTNQIATSALGIKAGTYYKPQLTISAHTQVPAYKLKDGKPRPTDSVWIKATKPNAGARLRVKRFNDATKMWDALNCDIFLSKRGAIYAMDKANGGLNIAIGDVFALANFDEGFGLDYTPPIANFKLMRRSDNGDTIVRSASIIGTSGSSGGSFTAGTKKFRIAESVLGSAVFGDYNKNGTYSDHLVTFTTHSLATDANAMVSAINAAGLVNVRAEIGPSNSVVIKHRYGGEIRFYDLDGQPLLEAGFVAFNVDTNMGTVNLYAAPQGSGATYEASLWKPLKYTAGPNEPTSLTADGQLWYNPTISDVDIMINDGVRWLGYSQFYWNADATLQTNWKGPIVSASTPLVQSDNTPLVTGDLWIDTSDIEHYPMIYRFNADLENKPIKNRWVLVDKTDQSTEEGIIFADARYNTSGAASNVPGIISELLWSPYVDFDAPDPALYPRGMMLWNTRRSGFNVKKFVQNYVNPADDNPRFGPSPVFVGESQELYYQHRWVTVSGNQEDGSGTFGRKAQRKVVVQHLQALVNQNQQIRDEESRVFNLIACPGYPELIGEMISLNYDRGLTAFVIGDTPARLDSTGTSLLSWGSNEKLAVEDNDIGAASHDEYMGMFYPWGYTSDNLGNNVVVPPSHMILRTIALNDQVAYPWFAPAGIRRGGITNATAVGYINNEGEFKSVALNNGQRDTLYSVNINPITFFANSGLVNFGQKTRARGASALDRINVARLVIYLRRRLSILSKPFLFEPNDKITRDELKGVIDSMMIELVSLRAITDFLVVCDTSNNTPTRIDRNELWVDIAIVPTKAVEFIYIPLRLKNTGAITS